MDHLRPFKNKENEIKTASPIIDSHARTLYETKGYKEYTLKGVKRTTKAYKGLEEAQKILLESLQGHNLVIETQHPASPYAKCSAQVLEWMGFLSGIQRTLIDSLDFSVIKPLEVLTDNEIPEILGQKKKFDSVARDYQAILNMNPNKRTKEDLDKARSIYLKKGDEVHQLINEENDNLAIKTLEEQCYIVELYLQYFKGGHTYLSKLHNDILNFKKFAVEERQANQNKKAKVKAGEWVPDALAEKPTARVFSISLKELVEREASPSSVPSVIEKAVQMIERKGLSLQGIFRISANKVTLDAIKQKLDEGGSVNFDDWDAHVAAGVIKLYLRSLPECLITADLYNDFISTGDLPLESQPQRLKELIAKLPQPNFATFKCIVGLCAKIAANEKDNMMSADNLAVVLAPTVMFSKDDTAGNILEMIKRGNIVLGTIIKHPDILEPTWSKAKLDAESPRNSGALTGFKLPPLPVPKAQPKGPENARAVVPSLEDDEPQSKDVTPAVPKRQMRRSLSQGDQSDINQWREQQIATKKVPPTPPKKPTYGIALPDATGKAPLRNTENSALLSSPKAPQTLPQTSVPKLPVPKVIMPPPNANVSPSGPDSSNIPSVSPRTHQKVNSADSTPPGGLVSPRTHQKVNSTGNTPTTPTGLAASVPKQPTASPRPGLTRAATANPAASAKPPVLPQPIQQVNLEHSPRNSTSNLNYLEYDLQCTIDLANQFVNMTLQVLSPTITVEDLNGINRLLKQLTQSTAQYINTIKQNAPKIQQHASTVTAFAKELRDAVNVVIADFKSVCTMVAENTGLDEAVAKCHQSIDLLARACYYNGALLTHLLQGDEFEAVKVNIQSTVNKLLTSMKEKSKQNITEYVYELASLASRLHAYANARGVEVAEVRAIIEPLQSFTKEVQIVCKHAAMIGEDTDSDWVTNDAETMVLTKANNVLKTLPSLKLPPPKNNYSLDDQTLFLKKTREELVRLMEFEEKFNAHRLVRMLITNLTKLNGSLEAIQTKFSNEHLKQWIVDGFGVCSSLLSIQNLINSTAKSCTDITLKEILMQYKNMLQTNLFRIRIALFGQFHRDQSIKPETGLAELGTKCDEFEINLFTELKNFVYGARPFIFNFNEAITKITE